MKKYHFLFLFVIVLCTGCGYNRNNDGPCLSSVSIVDRNGLSETIGNAERLKKYEDTDFLSNQPYKKVLRVYDRDCEGAIAAYVSSYHENGQPKQYLEIVNARAFGKYQEWYQNGVLKLDSNVIGGTADLSSGAELTWLFEGLNKAWAEDGHLLAEIMYSKGELEGMSTYYHPNGKIWKEIPYHKNQMEGTAKIYLENGTLLQEIIYCRGNKNGKSIRYWCEGKVAAQEECQNGLLTIGKYFDQDGKVLSEINEGNGYRVLFGKETMVEMHEYKGGQLSGQIKVFNKTGGLARLYHVKNELKHGDEIEYYPSQNTANLKPKISIHWHEGKIHGIVKTWYENNALESQREMVNNKKNGLLTGWYSDGNLMLIEEYDRDKLVRGEYFKRGERYPVSNVIAGKGIATLFDADGNFLHKVNYHPGQPPS